MSSLSSKRHNSTTTQPLPKLDFGGQIRITMADASVVFVAWDYVPNADNEYWVGFGGTSFLSWREPELLLGVSARRPWGQVIGRPVEFIFRDERSRVALQIRGPESRVCP